tara:strand:- start:157 stop:429 length:273 start_codon:yes stop_codon:yes gene_type:complete
MKTFKDLKFKKHPAKNGAIQAIIDFDNGHWISVIGGAGLDGDGKYDFDVMSSLLDKRAKFLKTIGLSPNLRKGWQTKKQVTAHMRYLQKL